MKKLFLAALLAVSVSAVASGAEGKGWFGFRLDVDNSGTIVNHVKIKSVKPNSPATAAHIGVGDEVVEAEGRAVAGGKVFELQPLMQKRVGETIHLKLKRANGETYSAAVTATKRPG